MTTHDDRTDGTDRTDRTAIETRLRASLRDRAEDVATTPALYERVQRQATRGTWLRRGIALAGAAVVVVAVVAIAAPLLPDQTPIDIADTPQDAGPTDGPTAEEDIQPAVPADGAPASLEELLADAGVAYARDAASGGSSVHVADRVVTSPVRVVSLAASPASSGEQDLAAGRQDGTIGVIDTDDTGDQFDRVVDASANGGGVTFAPAGDAIAWLQGRALHVLPASDAAEERVLPLVGDVPDDLRIEQWFSQADAQIILASDPDGGVWRIPMDDSNSFNSAPTEPASLLPGAEDANDALLLPDLQLVTVLPSTDGGGVSMTIGGEVLPVPASTPESDRIELSGPVGQMITMYDPTIGWGVVQSVTERATGGVVVTSWQDPSIVAVVPTLPLDQTGAGTMDIPEPTDDMTAEDTTAGEMSAPGDAAALGLPTDAPVIGTSGVDLLVRTADGDVQTIAVYPEESEATLGSIAVRPGSTRDAGLVAVASTSEGEPSIRFVALRDGQAVPVGDGMATDGPVTGLVWSEDGAHVAWTDETGLRAGAVTDEGRLSSQPQLLNGNQPPPVADWTWEEVADTADGRITTSGVGAIPSMVFEVSRAADGSLSEATRTVDGGVDLVLDVHATPGSAGGPQVVARRFGDTARLSWVAGDATGRLADPGIVGESDDADVHVDASGGQVIVLGSSRQVLVTFDGAVVDLPLATDWDVLD